jgi:hypothetical protein
MNKYIKLANISLKLTYYVYDDIIDIEQSSGEDDPPKITFISDRPNTKDATSIEFADIDELIEILKDAKGKFNKVTKLINLKK